jgi:CheY-like chemotaxis protein
VSAARPYNQSILVVEDEDNDAILLKRALQRAGITLPIFILPGGAEAMAYLSADPPYQDRGRYPFPSLLFLDIRMPRVDGFEVLRWIRQNPQFDNLPIIMLTGSSEKGDSDKAYQLGATSFLVKSADLASAVDLSREVARLVPAEEP